MRHSLTAAGTGPAAAWELSVDCAACSRCPLPARAARCRYDNLLEAPAKYRGDTRVKFTTKILAIRGNASAACCCLLLLLLAVRACLGAALLDITCWAPSCQHVPFAGQQVAAGLLDVAGSQPPRPAPPGCRLQRIKIERNLPYDINYKMNIVRFHERPRTVSESGIEGITFAFKWTWYPGHHLVSS